MAIRTSNCRFKFGNSSRIDKGIIRIIDEDVIISENNLEALKQISGNAKLCKLFISRRRDIFIEIAVDKVLPISSEYFEFYKERQITEKQ